MSNTGNTPAQALKANPVGAVNTANAGAVAGTPNATADAQSQQDQKETQSQQPEAQVIAVGAVKESAPSNAAGAKSFFSRFPGSSTHLPDGTAVIFHHTRDSAGRPVGKHTTTDEAVIKHLSAIADKPGSQVYTVADVPQDTLSAKVAEEAADTQKNA